jgi:four helix bundle protein
MSHGYRDLVVWQKAKSLACEVYRVTDGFPKTEAYGLTSQMRRAAVSVASNIAEGQGGLTKGEFAQFLGHARGSLLELETQLDITQDLKFIEQGQFSRIDAHTGEVLKMLNGLIDSLRVRRQ